MIKLDRRLLVPYTLILAALFYAGLVVVGLNTFIAVLNGAFIGALLAIAVTYSRVVRSWLFGDAPSDSVSMFGLFFVLTWAIVGMFVINGIYIRSADLPYTSLLTTAIGRYALIVCVWGMIAALDYGQGWLYGRDRKLLYAGIGVGVGAALVLIYAQQYQVLS